MPVETFDQARAKIEAHAKTRKARGNGSATADDDHADAVRFRFLRVSELLRQPTPAWRVLRVIPARGLVVLWGASGSGKTFLALDLACSIVRGLPWAGRRTRRGPVAYIAAEGQLRERVDAYLTHHALGSAELDGLRVLDSAVNLLDPAADLGSLLFALGAMAAETGPLALVIVDTLNRVMPGGDENSSEDIGTVIAAAKKIEDATGCAVLFVHHSGKDESKGSRGHSSLKAATDAELSVRRDGDARTLTAEKVRDGIDGDALLVFGLHAVDLGPMTQADPQADPDERRTSCVVVPAHAAPTTNDAGRLTPTDEIALRVLREMCVDTDELTAATSIHPAGLPIVRVDDWRERFRRARGVDKADAKAMNASRMAFQRAIDRLVQRRIVGVNESKAWLW